MKVALLTGGKDAHYVRGLVRQLTARDLPLVVVGSTDMADIERIPADRLEFHNLVGDNDPDAALSSKVLRLLRYYWRLMLFVARTDADLLHVLWFRKFPKLERIALSLYVTLLRKPLVFTAHNVDDEARDGHPTLLGRLSLRLLYIVADHILVHTVRMRHELGERFHIPTRKVTVLPFGTNDVVPVLAIPRSAARRKLGIADDLRVLLFFGNLAPYKGVEDLLRALALLVADDRRFLLILSGRAKDKSCEEYCRGLDRLIDELRLAPHLRRESRYVSDHEAALLFRAADVSVLPYRRIYQSGVLALSYAQGLPVIVPDIGSMKDDVLDGDTGLVFRPGDVSDLATTIHRYFGSPLFHQLDVRAEAIQRYGTQRFSWPKNAELTMDVYARTLEVTV
jgi:D-inositol-3-phosphate glycosyltransferase